MAKKLRYLPRKRRIQVCTHQCQNFKSKVAPYTFEAIILMNIRIKGKVAYRKALAPSFISFVGPSELESKPSHTQISESSVGLLLPSK